MGARSSAGMAIPFSLWIALTLVFFMALIPLGHKMPAFGPIPRIGPFEAEPLRASVLGLCILISLITVSFGRQARGALKPFGYSFAAAPLRCGNEIRRVRLVDPDRGELHGHLPAPAMDE
jgi:hypothetical protein